MGLGMSEPITDKETVQLKDSRFFVGASSMQGWRLNMEDYHSLLLDMDSGKSFFAVFDGHGGSKVAKYASENLHLYIMNSQHYDQGDYVSAISDGFLSLDRYLHVTYGESLAKLSGCTAVCLLVADGMVHCGNLGDSRAVACVDRECVQLSFDHKPDNDEETKRIRQAGGYIEGNRVNGNLALSRAFGDFHYKSNLTMPPSEQMVSPCPEIQSIEFNEKVDFLFLACDGIWDVLSNEELVEFVSDRIEEKIEPHIICEQLMSFCLAPDYTAPVGCDNMTCVLICNINGMSYEDYCTQFISRITHHGRIARKIVNGQFSNEKAEDESQVVDDAVDSGKNCDDGNSNSKETFEENPQIETTSESQISDAKTDKDDHSDDERDVSELKASQDGLSESKDNESTDDGESPLETSKGSEK